MKSPVQLLTDTEIELCIGNSHYLLGGINGIPRSGKRQISSNIFWGLFLVLDARAISILPCCLELKSKHLSLQTTLLPWPAISKPNCFVHIVQSLASSNEWHEICTIIMWLAYHTTLTADSVIHRIPWGGTYLERMYTSLKHNLPPPQKVSLFA